ncbi:MAG: hypothetical protein M3R69_07305 [Acidobacteriota bacterium]|nr:hypothetical protein [Acidobacteriota bacterium]
MLYRRLISFAAVIILALAASVTIFAANSTDKGNETGRVYEPVNLAVLIQDDLTTQVSNELDITRDFITSLPSGSRVMVGYITAGSLQIRQPFTTDLGKAGRSLRILRSSESGSPFNPYEQVVQALRSFNGFKGRNAVLLISDGLDTSRGFDLGSSLNTIDLERAIKQANDRKVAVYSFYAPSVGLTSRSGLAASFGQSSLNRLANDTGGEAFFQGISGFVTFDSYFKNLRQTLNEQSARPS